jgi:nucleoid DNA-binding protein
LNRTDFSEKIAKFCSISVADAKQILDFITETIGNTLANGEEVHITGFGNFYTTEVPAKGFKMPNGEIFKKEPFKAIKFAATGKLKDKVNGRTE